MSDENPTDKETEMALEDSDFVVPAKGWNRDRAFKILAATCRKLKTQAARNEADLLRSKADGLELGKDSDRKECEAWASALRKEAAAKDPAKLGDGKEKP